MCEVARDLKDVCFIQKDNVSKHEREIERN